MATFTKKFVYILNILTVICLISVVLFSANFIVSEYTNLSRMNHSVIDKYNEILVKYRRIIVYILKNNLPENINYFNSASRVIYNLPPIKKFKVGESIDALFSKQNNGNPSSKVIDNMLGCHNGKCVTVVVDSRAILNKIINNKKWEYVGLTEIPAKEVTLLKKSICLFIEENKFFLIVMLLYFFVIYLFQFLCLFFKNHKLTKAYALLLVTSDKNNQELVKQTYEHEKVCSSLLFSQKLVSEYFSHYIHTLVTRDVCINEVNLGDILLQVENFFNPLIIKQKLTLTLSYKKSATINTDGEIVFIILLNLVFKSIFKAKISSEVTIKIFQTDRYVSVEMRNAGYEYKSKLNTKIQIYELPDPILENLYKKIGVEVEEYSEGQAGLVFAKFLSNRGINKTDNKVIKLNLRNRR